MPEDYATARGVDARPFIVVHYAASSGPVSAFAIDADSGELLETVDFDGAYPNWEECGIVDDYEAPNRAAMHALIAGTLRTLPTLPLRHILPAVPELEPEPEPEPIAPAWPNHREPVRMHRLYHYGDGGFALLPTGKKLNPCTLEGHYSEPGQQSLEVVRHQDNGYLRVLTTFGRSDRIPGDSMVIRHDQTCALLGTFDVIGVKQSTGEWVGEVPNKNLAHWVYK